MSPFRFAAIALAVPLAGCDKVIVLEDGNNYTYSGDVTIPAYLTAPATDVELCWDQVLNDIQCHELEPTEDINLVSLIRFPHLTEEDVEYKVSNDSLQQVDQDGYVELETMGGTCANLSELSFFGTPIDVPNEYNADSTYLLTVSTGTTTGLGTRVMAFLTPTEGEEGTSVGLESGCGVLDFEGDIESLTSIPVKLDGPWVFDWSALTTNGLGNTLNLANVDGLLLGYYAGASTQDLQEQFLDLELIADKTWSTTLSGTTGFDLAELSDFTGFTADGTWILGLTCSTCANPAPLFLTVLEPSE
ncbi:MAG: hypothetical protein P8R54_10740 [Myxococcota bacterium]|nr:hypothetical protein [Myxococcota bacterium]